MESSWDSIDSNVKAAVNLKLLREWLRFVRGPYVKAVILFGSGGRGEAEERSDVDLLVLHDGCEIVDSVLRRRYFYNLIRDVVGKHFDDITVLDMELKEFLKPKRVNALLLNIYWDAQVVLDKTGVLDRFLEHVKKRIVKSGLRRVKDGRAYYWVLPAPKTEVKIL
ncbi:MAG: nucleotidyltransferase domain-containing protein [Candidatus Bathyarchaeia archaeon]